MGNSRSNNDLVEKTLAQIETVINGVIAPAGTTDLSAVKNALARARKAVDGDEDLHSVLQDLQRAMWKRADLFLNALSAIGPPVEQWGNNVKTEDGDKNAR